MIDIFRQSLTICPRFVSNHRMKIGEFGGVQLTTDSYSFIDDFCTVHVLIDGANHLIESKLILKVLFVNYLKFVSVDKVFCFGTDSGRNSKDSEAGKRIDLFKFEVIPLVFLSKIFRTLQQLFDNTSSKSTNWKNVFDATFNWLILLLARRPV